MSVYGVALLPCKEDIDALVRFQQAAGKHLTGITLGQWVSIPHVTIAQGALKPDALTVSLLNSLVKDCVSTGCSIGKLADMQVRPDGWVYAPIASVDEDNGALWCREFHNTVLARLSKHVDTRSIDETRDVTGYTDAERESYAKFGYAYLGEAFNPHITLGCIPRTKVEPAAALTDLYNVRLLDRELRFDRLCIYRAASTGSIDQLMHVVHVDQKNQKRKVA